MGEAPPRTDRGGILLLLLAATAAVPLSRWRRDAQALAQRTYRELVLGAVLSLELAPLSRKTTTPELGYAFFEEFDLSGDPAEDMDPTRLALRDLDRAVALLPDRPDARYHRARSLFGLRRFEEAHQAAAALAMARPPFLPALTLIADLHLRRYEVEPSQASLRAAAFAAHEPWEAAWVEAARAELEGDLGAALKAYGALYDRTSSDREPFLGYSIAVLLGRGRAALAQGDFVQAARDFASARQIAPGAVQPLLLEAQAWHRLGKPAEAAAILETAYASSPRRDEVALAVVGVYRSVSDTETALSWARRITVAAVRDAIQGFLLWELGRYEEGLVCSRRAVAENPRSVGAHVFLGSILREVPQLAEGRQVLEKALTFAPESYSVHRWLAYHRFRVGDFAGALHHFQAASRLSSDALGLERFWLVGLPILLGQTEEGFRLLKTVRAASPRNPVGENDLGLLLFDAGFVPEALEAVTRSVSVRPGFAFSRSSRGRYLRRLGRTEEALSEWRAAQKLFPFHFAAFSLPWEVLTEREEHEAALLEILPVLRTEPGHAGTHVLAARSLRALRGAPLAEGPEVLRLLEEALEGAPASPWARHSLALALLVTSRGDAPALERSLKLLMEALSVTPASAGDGEEIRRTLVGAMEGAAEGHPSGVLDLLPALPPVAAIDALVEAKLLRGDEKVPASSPGEGRSPAEGFRRSFLLAAVAAAAGNAGQAAKRLEAVTAGEPAALEPIVRRAQFLEEAGDPRAALATLRAAAASPAANDRRFWDLCLRIGLVVLKEPPVELAAELSSPTETPGKVDNTVREEARWLLARLAAGEPIRINSGGDDYLDSEGSLWGRDRFALGGNAGDITEGTIQGTRSSSLYVTQRYFRLEETEGSSGYRIPLPPGDYQVTLHFAEIQTNLPENRRFDILLQAKEAAKDFDIVKPGFRTAVAETFRCTVGDEALLSIEFRPHTGSGATVSAIEVRPSG